MISQFYGIRIVLILIAFAPFGTPAPVTNKGLADASLVADIMKRKYQLGVPLFRQEKNIGKHRAYTSTGHLWQTG